MTVEAPRRSDPRRSGGRVLRIAVRIALAVALVVLIGLNAVKHGPALVAAIAPAPDRTAVVAGPTTSTPPAASASASASAKPSASASTGAGTGTGTGTGTGSSGGSGSGSGAGSGGGSGSGSGTTTRSSAPKASTTPLVITNFDAEDVQCPQPSGGQFSTTAPNPDVIPEWNSTGAVRAWFGIDTDDAKANPYEEVDTNGAVQFTWPCPTASQQYALTIEDAAGHDVTRTYTAHNTGYKG